MVPTHFLSVVSKNEKRVWLTPARRCRQNEEKTQLCKSLSPDCTLMRMLLNLNGTERCSSSSSQNVLLSSPRCHTQSWVRYSCTGSTLSTSVCCLYRWSDKGLRASSFYIESVIIFITITITIGIIPVNKQSDSVLCMYKLFRGQLSGRYGHTAENKLKYLSVMLPTPCTDGHMNMAIG